MKRTAPGRERPEFLALAFKSRQDPRPLQFMESWISNTLHRNGCEHIDVAGERDFREPCIKGDSLNALYGLPHLARVIAATHVFFDERPHHHERDRRAPVDRVFATRLPGSSNGESGGTSVCFGDNDEMSPPGR